MLMPSQQSVSTFWHTNSMVRNMLFASSAAFTVPSTRSQDRRGYRPRHEEEDQETTISIPEASEMHLFFSSRFSSWNNPALYRVELSLFSLISPWSLQLGCCPWHWKPECNTKTKFLLPYCNVGSTKPVYSNVEFLWPLRSHYTFKGGEGRRQNAYKFLGGNDFIIY